MGNRLSDQRLNFIFSLSSIDEMSLLIEPNNLLLSIPEQNLDRVFSALDTL